MAFTFLHAADLHLDSPFKGVTAQSGAVARALQAATFEAFESLLALAEQEEALFILLAGDVYDGADRSIRAQLRFRDGLARLAQKGIRSFVVHGNHDALDGWSSALTWPEEVHIFGSDKAETVHIDQGGKPVAAISGISYAQRRELQNLAQRLEAHDPDLFQIALLHANCGADTGHEDYAPCRLDDLVGSGFDYWALGHVHTRAVLHESPHVVYPGNTQGRSIRESGPRGCYIVRVDGTRHAELAFHQLDSIRWAAASVSIDGLESLDALERAMGAALEQVRDEAQGRSAVCRLTLEGRGPLYDDLRRENALGGLRETLRETFSAGRPFIWLEEVTSRCRPEVDLTQRAQQNDLLAEALTVAEDLLGQENLSGRLEPVLAALFEHHRAQKALGGLPSETELRELVDEARWLCLDLLEGAE